MTKDEHAMAVEKVRHMGDLVACVCAETEAIAIEALSLFEIEWELLEPVFDRKKGLEDVDEPIHWRGSITYQKPMFKRECSKNSATVLWLIIHMLHLMVSGVWKEYIMVLLNRMR